MGCHMTQMGDTRKTWQILVYKSKINWGFRACEVWHCCCVSGYWCCKVTWCLHLRGLRSLRGEILGLFNYCRWRDSAPLERQQMQTQWHCITLQQMRTQWHCITLQKTRILNRTAQLWRPKISQLPKIVGFEDEVGGRVMIKLICEDGDGHNWLSTKCVPAACCCHTVAELYSFLFALASWPCQLSFCL